MSIPKAIHEVLVSDMTLYKKIESLRVYNSNMYSVKGIPQGTLSEVRLAYRNLVLEFRKNHFVLNEKEMVFIEQCEKELGIRA